VGTNSTTGNPKHPGNTREPREHGNKCGVYHKPHEPPTPTLQERPEVMQVSFAKEVLEDSPNKGNIEEM
jgi:hypothetical protein